MSCSTFRILLRVLCGVAVIVSPAIAMAQGFDLTLPEGQTLTGTTVNLILLLTVLSLAPGLAMMVTCFPFIITVFSILRTALGLQQAPPNILLISLALFLTYFVMEPTFLAAWNNGIQPLSQETIDVETAIPRIIDPFRVFMANRVDGETFMSIAELRSENSAVPLSPEAPLSILVSSFLLSEISLAFQVGFLIFLPFLIIDLVVAAILMSMGMMMVPPIIVSLPFKLAFFVVSDGWSLVADSLVRGYF